ncbi:hypothetical protein APV28_2121 [Comamonas testosteroni]|nr:hypothetical protein APV28_2121 [Comamonas testosteroni]
MWPDSNSVFLIATTACQSWNSISFQLEFLAVNAQAAPVLDSFAADRRARCWRLPAGRPGDD